MFTYEFTKKLRKQLTKLSQKDKVLSQIFFRKFAEVVNRDIHSIHTYKNLRSPLNDLKRIHLTDNFILLFKYYPERGHILFTKISHWDGAYK